MKKGRIQIQAQIEETDNRLKNACNLFADGKIDQSDYRKLKEECQPKLNALERKLSGMKQKVKNITGILKTTRINLTQLDKKYLEGHRADIEPFFK